jgi:DNA/RNA-binding domain of Phe-tRNA-synthetase-like protein
MQLLVTDRFWSLFPEARIGVVLARGLDNTRAEAAAAALLAEAVAATVLMLDGIDIPTHAAVAPWRTAYSQFGAKPSKFRSSIESLLRAAQAGRLRSINPLVDLYNTVSLRHLLPCGGEDLAALIGDVQLTRADGGEPFRPLGADADDPPPAGEVIYRDAAGAICRCWNWREAERTKLTSATRDALLVIEALPAHPQAQLNAALADLASLLTTHLGGTSESAVLTPATPTLALT